MNKQILSIFVLCAFSYSTQAQEVKGGISDSMMQQIKQSYANTPTDKAIRNAIGSNDIRKLALNQDNLKGMDTHFSIKVPSKGITDQKSSGRCWLFTGLNVMRAVTIVSFILLRVFLQIDGSDNLFYTHQGNKAFVLLPMPDDPANRAYLHNILLPLCF